MDWRQRTRAAIMSVLGAVGIGAFVCIVVYYIVKADSDGCDPENSSSEACPESLAAFVFGSVAGCLAAAAAVVLIGRRRGLGAVFCYSCLIPALLLTALWTSYWFGI